MKYDKNGVPLRNQEAPAFVEVTPAVEVPEPMVEEQTVNGVETVETPSNDVVEETPITPVAKPEDKTINWKKLRDEREAADKKIKELEAALAAKVEKLPEEDLSLDLDDDSLAEGKHLKQVDKRFQKMEQQLKKYEQQAAQAALQLQLKSKYPDWDHVYNEENLARLQVQEPEIFQALNASSDVMRAGVSAYKMIKQMGLVAQPDLYERDKAQAQANASKPKSLASISPQQGDSPLSKANAFANGLTDDLRKQMLKEMNDARKGY